MQPLRLSRGITQCLLGLILLSALIARLLGVHRGIPYLQEWDEPYNLGFVIGMFQRGDFNPQTFTYPSVSLYLRLPVVYAQYFYLHARHLIGSPNDIQLFHPQAFGAGVYDWIRTYPWYSNYPSFYVWSRVLTAVLGAATVFLVYRLGTELFDDTVGLLAATFLTLAPGAIYYISTVRPDLPMTFFVVATALSGVAILSGGTRRSYLVSGLLAGLAPIGDDPREHSAHRRHRSSQSFAGLAPGVPAWCPGRIIVEPAAQLAPPHLVDLERERPLALFSLTKPRDRTRRVEALLDMVRLPAAYRTRFPHQLSGGERQRVAVALPGVDPVTTTLEAVPLLVLYEGSIWLSALLDRRSERLKTAVQT